VKTNYYQLNKSVSLLLVILGLKLFLFFFKREFNSDLSKEWIASVSGIFVAVILFVKVISKPKKN